MNMQEQNKENLLFLAKWAAIGLVIFFTVVMLTFVGAKNLWSAVVPVAAIAYAIREFYVDHMKDDGKKEGKE